MVLRAYKESIQLFNQRTRLKIRLFNLLQAVIALLDLVGVSIFGFIGVIAVRGIESTPQSGKSLRLLQFLHIHDLTLLSQVSILGAISVFVMIMRSVLSIYIGIHSYQFLGNQSAILGDQIARKLMNRTLQANSTTDLQEKIYVLTSGLEKIGFGIIGLSGVILSDLMLSILLCLVLLIVSPWLTLISIAILGLSVATSYLRMHKVAEKIGEEDSKLQMQGHSLITELMSSYRQLKLRNRRDWYLRKFTINRKQHLRKYATLSMLPNISKYIIESIMVLSAVLIACYAFSIGDAVRSVSILTIFMASISRLAPALLRLQQNGISLKSNIGLSKPIFSMLQELKETSPIQDVSFELKLSHVGFPRVIEVSNLNFDFGGEFFLEDINFQISAGESVAIVGPSGSGKSSLVDLLLGMQEPTRGTIKFGEQSLDEIISKWPGSISYVPQETYLKNGTIRENLMIGFDENELKDSAIWEALEIANLKDFVNELPYGLLENIGEGGNKLSGGQKQRLGIARALLTNPQVLVLDEATSALDVVTENIITSNLNSFMKDRFLIVIAHRLVTVQHAQNIIYLEKGKIKGMGSFSDLRVAIPEFEKQAQLSSL